MNETGQNTAAAPHGLIKFVCVSNSGGDSPQQQQGEAGRAAFSLSVLKALSDKGFLQRPPQPQSLHVVISQRIIFRGSRLIFRDKL